MWMPDANAVTMLDSIDGPFGTRLFREAVVATVPGWKDVSFGARAPDGTLAAVPLLQREREGESVPPLGYGGTACTRPLSAHEMATLLEAMWRARRLRRVRVRWLDVNGQTPGVGRPLAIASVVAIDPNEPPTSRYARLARRSLKRAVAAGAVVAQASADEFWPVYTAAARGWSIQYPEPLIRRLVAVGAAVVHAVRIDGRVVAVLLTLVGAAHWMCWLAAQTEAGRRIAASYLAYDAVFAQALAAGIRFVNLGASVSGGAEFKRHLGAVEVGMYEWTKETMRVAVARRVRATGVAFPAVARRAGARGR